MCSGMLHLAVLIALAVGLPDLGRPLEVPPPIPVEVVDIDDITRPKPAEKPVPVVEEAQPEDIPDAPQPPVQHAAAPPPPPPPEAPKPEIRPPEPAEPEAAAEALPEPEPLPDPEPKPEAQEKVEDDPDPPIPAPRPKPRVELAKKPEPKRKPQQDRLAAILRNVEKLQEDTPRERTAEPKQKQRSAVAAETSQPMTISEIDAIRRQIERCWNVPAGARDAENLVVSMRVVLNPDGSVRRAEILDVPRMTQDPFYRTAAESALRAVKRCSPLQVPPRKYTIWREMTLTFNPREMFGQ